jgi:WD40 repeat protein
MKYFLFSVFLVIVVLNVHAQEIIQLGRGDVYDFCFSPQGSLAYLTNGKSVEIWDINKKTIVSSLDNGHYKSIISLDITKDSTFLVASSLDSVIVIWNLTNYTILKKVKIKSIANKVVFNNNGSGVIAGLRNGDLLYINSFSGEIIHNIETGQKEVVSIAILDKAGLIATSGAGGIIQLWNSDSFIMSDQISIRSSFIREIVCGTDEKQIYTCGDDGKVLCYNIKDKKQDKGFYLYNNFFKKSWIMSLDLLNSQIIAYANIRGDIFIEDYPIRYYYHISDNIFKLHFLPKNSIIVVGLASNNGLKIIWASKMKSKSSRMNSFSPV